MNKKTIIRYLMNELNKEETSQLFNWVEASPENRRYFNTIKNLWALNSNTASSTAPDFARLKLKIQTRSRSSKIIQFTGYLSKIAAILFIPATIGLLWLALGNTKQDNLPQTGQSDISIYTPLGSRAEFTLPDGTKVWLNSGSQLTYPHHFTGSRRKVSLKGEAYFEVTKNKDFPFYVSTPRGSNVLVKGTSFNLCAYDTDLTTAVTLVNGEVDFLHEKSNQTIRILPGQHVRYEEQRQTFSRPSDVATDIYTSWKEGILVFDHLPLPELIKRIERWYGVLIRVTDTTLLDFTYTGKIKEESISQVLEMLRQTSDISYKIDGKNILLSRKE